MAAATVDAPAGGAWLPAIGAYLAAWVALLAAMHLREGFGVAEPLFVLVVFGGAYTALAWWATRGAVPRDVVVRAPARELTFVIAWAVFLAIFITWGFPVVRGLSTDPTVQSGAIIVAKLATFVVLPFLALRALFGCRVSDFVDLRRGLGGHWRAFLVVGIALVAFQLVFGRAPRDLEALDPGVAEIGMGATLALIGATIEAGLVEEFFFRALLLERLAARLRAGWALVLSAGIFGLAHAPGLYLRPEVTMESLAEPSLLMAIGYSVVILSVTGLMFGILWLRTRNLLLVALLHGLNDCVPATAEKIEWLRSLA
jgi:membrane protease YdiL (CAAX protease family)